ncbi:sugar transferase [Microvirga sp. 2MCAF38]|uniref:sugar transferase n=1 Tax=Microvirga sp. 2MCAF38 TaxID=3232989 RepID=UPI003F97EA77
MEPERASRRTVYPDVSLKLRPIPLKARHSESRGFSSGLPAGIDVSEPSRSPNYSTSRSGTDRRLELALKRGFDIGVTLVLLVLLTPGLLLIAAAIKLTSPGPVLFRQQRYGLDRRRFEILKFRTMSVHACDPSGVKQVSRDDMRVTPVGRFLRKSSLDELPQLVNVLRGDMSLVGPRPHVPGMLAGGMLYEELVPEYFERLRVLPGVTGLAQVNGLRGSTEDPVAARARISEDLIYVERWSVALDIKIIIKTARSEFLSGTGF